MQLSIRRANSIEHEVADAVPQAVVDDLEAIEIEEEHGKTVSVAVVKQIEPALHEVREKRPISQSGQFVMESAVFERGVGRFGHAGSRRQLFGSLALGDVALHGNPMREVSRFVGDRDDAQLDPKRRPVFAVIEKLDFDRFPRV